jgi:death-on-curing protein
VTVRFLGVEEVIGIHARQLSEFGGGEGIRDQGLLASAIAQPEASFAGEYLHQDLYEMAAAYLFHLVQNHPFVDGNKRVGPVGCAGIPRHERRGHRGIFREAVRVDPRRR